MITRQLCIHYKILNRFNCSLNNCNTKLLYKNDNHIYSYYNFHRHYYLHSLKLLKRTDMQQISKRFISTENMVSAQSGIFKYISECSGTFYIKELVVSIHDFTGLPWWTTVILSTFILRTVIALPLAVYQVGNYQLCFLFWFDHFKLFPSYLHERFMFRPTTLQK